MKNRYPDLAKQVVFITGAASGIGAARKPKLFWNKMPLFLD